MKEMFKALKAFQSECPKIKKDSENPFFKSKYADLASIWEVVQPILAKHDLVLIQPIQGKEIKTILMHASGEIIESNYPIISKSEINPQDYGSAITYARRYALSSMLGIIADDDDDGNAAVHQRNPVQKPVEKKPIEKKQLQYWELVNNQLKAYIKEKLLTVKEVTEVIQGVTKRDSVPLAQMEKADIDMVLKICNDIVGERKFNNVGQPV